jgi:predicted MPP superfamily phosphohydrolase
MKLSQIIIFLVIVLLIYGSINFYILRRTWQALAGSPILRWVFFSLFLFLVLAYPAGRFLERRWGNSISALVITIGAYYFALMLYLLLAAWLVDLLRLSDKLFGIFPEAVRRDPQRSAEVAFLVGVGAALLTVVLGHLNTLHPRFKKLDLKIEKPAGALRELKIAFASDIHIGTVTGTETLERIIACLNSLEPDLALLPGDVFDEDISGARAKEVSRLLRSIRAPLGVYACTGNHDYYAGIERCLENLRLGGVTVLQDEAVKIADSFYLLGRKDPTTVRRGEKRTPLKDIAAGCDPSLPIILLDHQPLKLEEAAQNGIDLQISGHTHAGQLFPLNLINQLVWEVYWGYSLKGKTHYYVSCGAGTWGPPVRTGSYPEIVEVRLSFAGRE